MSREPSRAEVTSHVQAQVTELAEMADEAGLTSLGQILRIAAEEARYKFEEDAKKAQPCEAA